MDRYGIVMAGGGGTRFWPLSRKEKPKQFLNLSGNDIMVNETLLRFKHFAPKENLYIVTNVTQADLMKEVTKGYIEENHILSEPAARNTTACIGFAAMEIVKSRKDGVMCILPSDHFIKDEAKLYETLEKASKVVEETDALVTIGIKPTYPATGYGYIKGNENKENYYVVEEFVEKPNFEVAKEYVNNKNYFWNSGMFVWKASTILKYIEKLLPDVYACLEVIGDAIGTENEQTVINEVYPTIPKISIDYGIMERADKVLMLTGEFGWNDIGSLDKLSIMKDADQNQNVCYTDTIAIESNNNIVYGNGKLIALVGIENAIVVQTEDALLICDKEHAQKVNGVVAELEKDGMVKYL